MYFLGRSVLVLVIAIAPVLRAENTANPYGHWEGAIATPSGEIQIEIDLAKSAAGKPVATFSNVKEKLNGLPLANVIIEGESVAFEIAANGGGKFECGLMDAGKQMACGFTPATINATLPLTLTRTGEARIETAPVSAAIAKELEGTWRGAIESGGRLELILKLANQSDGTSTGSIISVNQGGIELPITISGEARKLSFAIKAVNGAWAGALNAEGTELAGTFTEQGAAMPLVFRRDAAKRD